MATPNMNLERRFPERLTGKTLNNKMPVEFLVLAPLNPHTH